MLRLLRHAPTKETTTMKHILVISANDPKCPK